MMIRHFYLVGDSARILARVTPELHLYEYWDRKTKAWMPSAYAADCVTGYKGGHAVAITEDEAVAFMKKLEGSV